MDNGSSNTATEKSETDNFKQVIDECDFVCQFHAVFNAFRNQILV